MNKRKLARIAVASAVYSIDKPYTYLIPEKLENKVVPGILVTIPFGRGNRRCEGIVLSVSEETELSDVKAVDTVIDNEPVLTQIQLQLAVFIRDRYFCTLYEAARAMLPAGMWFRDGRRRIGDKVQKFVSLAIPAEDAAVIAAQKQIRAPKQADVLKLMCSVGSAPLSDVCEFAGTTQSTVNSLIEQELLTVEYREIFRGKALPAADADRITLSDEQNIAFEGLTAMLNTGKAEAALLYGVTGSGKTSVYIELVRKTVELGRKAIVLVPEIGLTPQFVSIFSSHFGEKVAVLHSSLSMGERYDEWKRVKSGQVDVVIGTRSAIFAPVNDIGLIIIDEEQEHTYKSENNPRYHARDVAKYLCVKNKSLLLLGSATPSVDSMYSAQCGKYKLFTINERYNKRPLPEVIIADMRREIKNGNGGVISSVLREELEKNIAAGEQSILFLNRRGASHTVICGECGYTYSCPNCSVSMTYHSVGNRLLCHYCGHSEPIGERCPDCGGKLKFIGAGTQKAEEELSQLFPGVGIIRMDTDTVSHVGSHEKLLEQFRCEKIPILLGTQMITKGLDFENVTLVGVISADQSLYSGDFRSREQTFSMITQVIGRSGRGKKSGRAVIQTYTPENDTIKLASHQDYNSFYESEIEIRKLSMSPPVHDLITITVSGLSESMVLNGCIKIRESLYRLIPESQEREILGPAPAGVTKVNNRYRYKVSVLCENTRKVRDIISHVLRQFAADKEFRGLMAFADSDPLN